MTFEARPLARGTGVRGSPWRSRPSREISPISPGGAQRAMPRTLREAQFRAGRTAFSAIPGAKGAGLGAKEPFRTAAATITSYPMDTRYLALYGAYHSLGLSCALSRETVSRCFFRERLAATIRLYEEWHADDSAMGTYITDLKHFLTKDGAIAAIGGQAKRFADILTMIVVDATTPSAERSSTSKVQCWHRPGRKRCTGLIEAGITPDTDAIRWECPACGNNGIISNWQGTLWDRSGDEATH